MTHYAAYSLLIGPLFVGIIVLLMQGSKTNDATFIKQFSGLMLGASALMVGYSWHQTVVRLARVRLRVRAGGRFRRGL